MDDEISRGRLPWKTWSSLVHSNQGRTTSGLSRAIKKEPQIGLDHDFPDSPGPGPRAELTAFVLIDASPMSVLPESGHHYYSIISSCAVVERAHFQDD
jgi:hypothetical protein